MQKCLSIVNINKFLKYLMSLYSTQKNGIEPFNVCLIFVISSILQFPKQSYTLHQLEHDKF